MRLAMDKRFGERQVFSLWQNMCGFNMSNVADYVRFGCGGLCAVVISTYRSSFPELKNNCNPKTSTKIKLE